METINNFYPQFKLHECADLKHETLRNIHFENGYAYASDSHVAIRANLHYISNLTDEEIELLEDKSIDARLFGQIIEYPKVKVKDDGFYVEDERTPMFFGFNRQAELKFPDAQNVIEQAISNAKVSDKISIICMNIDFLNKLCKASDCYQFRFDFNDNGAVLCRDAFNPEKYDAIQGIIMPIITEEL